jgi:short-subunit dehydrogenase
VDFNNKIVLLTGASSGIGYELAKKIALKSAGLIMAARRVDILNDLAEKLKSTSGKIISVKCDVSIPSDITAVVKTAIEKFGRIDIAILNSGTSLRSAIEEGELDGKVELMKVNTLSFFYFFDELIPFMKQKGGIIAGVSSLAGARGFPYSGAYSASKAAATKLLESYRVELKKYNIKVITVKPGFVRTPMTDKNKFYMPFMMEAEKAADIIISGIEREKRIIQFPLPTVIMSKLVKLVPNSIFDYFSAKIK